MTTTGITDGKALYLMRAVADPYIGKPGDACGFDIWDKMEGAPTLVLSFADDAAIKRMIDSLKELSMALTASASA